MNMKLKTRFVQAYFVPLGQWNKLCLSEVFNYVAGSEFFFVKDYKNNLDLSPLLKLFYKKYQKQKKICVIFFISPLIIRMYFRPQLLE